MEGFELYEAPDVPDIRLEFPIRAQRDFSQLWPRMNRGMRYIILDHLERYAASINKENPGDSPGWARFRIRMGAEAGLTGEIQYRLKLRNARRKLEDHIEIMFLPESPKYKKLPEQLGLTHNQKAIWTDIHKLMATPHVVEADIANIWKIKRETSVIRIEDDAKAIIERIPADIIDDVLRAVADHNITYCMTNALGEAGLTKVHFGIEARKKENETRIAAIGFISDYVYYQNGWLMVKLENLPAALGTVLEIGKPIETFFQVRIKNGISGTLSPLAGLVISKTMKGKTWMGPHVQLKLKFPGDRG